MVFKVIKGKENIFYISFTIFTSLLILFFISSKAFMYDDEPIMQTPLHTNITGLDQTTVTIERWSYNPKSALMEVILQMKHTGTDAIKPTFSFRAKEKTSLEVLPIEVVFHDDETYVIHVKKVPTEYSVIGLFLKENRDKKLLTDLSTPDIEGENNRSMDSKEIVVTGDYRKVVIDKQVNKKESYQYIEETIQSDIDQLEKQMTMIQEQQIPLQDQVIAAVEKEITQLKENQKYETKEEKLTTNSDIVSKKSEIKSAKMKQKEGVEEIKKMKEKIGKLEKKKADVREKKEDKK